MTFNIISGFHTNLLSCVRYLERQSVHQLLMIIEWWDICLCYDCGSWPTIDLHPCTCILYFYFILWSILTALTMADQFVSCRLGSKEYPKLQNTPEIYQLYGINGYWWFVTMTVHTYVTMTVHTYVTMTVHTYLVSLENAQGVIFNIGDGHWSITWCGTRHSKEPFHYPLMAGREI